MFVHFCVTFTGDLGGYMGLLLGASVISLLEVIDFIVFKLIVERKVTKDEKNSENDDQETNGTAHGSNETKMDDKEVKAVGYGNEIHIL